MLRSMAERASRGVAFWRRLPADMGGIRMRVSPESGGLRYWKLNLESVDGRLLGLAREIVKPGSAVWDVGANVGLMTFAAAALAGPKGFVLAVEPDVDNQRLILKSIAENAGRIAPVELVCAAVSNASKRFARFEIASRSRSSNALAGLGNTQGGSVRETRTVILLTLDDLLDGFRAPDFIKIDVEGAESDALAGATRVLAGPRPIFHIEVNDECIEGVTRQLQAADYVLFDGSLPGPQRTAQIEKAVWDTLAIPKEKVAGV